MGSCGGGLGGIHAAAGNRGERVIDNLDAAELEWIGHVCSPDLGRARLVTGEGAVPEDAMKWLTSVNASARYRAATLPQGKVRPFAGRSPGRCGPW